MGAKLTGGEEFEEWRGSRSVHRDWGKMEIGGARCGSVGKVLAGSLGGVAKTRLAAWLHGRGGEMGWRRRGRACGNGGGGRMKGRRSVASAGRERRVGGVPGGGSGWRLEVAAGRPGTRARRRRRHSGGKAAGGAGVKKREGMSD